MEPIELETLLEIRILLHYPINRRPRYHHSRCSKMMLPTRNLVKVKVVRQKNFLSPFPPDVTLTRRIQTSANGVDSFCCF